MNNYLKQEADQKQLNDLAHRYTYAALYLLATDLRLDHRGLLRIIGGVQGISPELAKKINYLWQIKFGTVYYPGTRPSIPESAVFYYLDSLFGKKNPYLDPVFWDKLPFYVSEEEYDGALTRVRNKINKVLDVFFKNLHVEPASYISVGTLYLDEVPETRIFEFNIVDRDTRAPQYALVYFKGEVQLKYGNVPDEIVPILQEEGAWE